MARLIPSDPARGRLPIATAGLTLTAVDPGPVAWTRRDVPAPGRAVASDGAEGARRLWCGRGQALVLGGRAGAGDVDVSDGWTVLRLDGAAWREVLSRLTPLDLRGLGPGMTARTMLGHMTAQITPVADEAVEVMVMRSMTGTAVEEIAEAMARVQHRQEG